ncbi:unnamed protein product [Protopolystoma xenopodis]|uniref:Uncharacterized protein n=1 Tax=Protopolystoma xenopodis TaxID=117903 RepID=A0A3S5C4L3_9PLAT|nr:unnamed protein product [Protopolystoma xenopodis]
MLTCAKARLTSERRRACVCINTSLEWASVQVSCGLRVVRRLGRRSDHIGAKGGECRKGVCKFRLPSDFLKHPNVDNLADQAQVVGRANCNLRLASSRTWSRFEQVQKDSRQVH